MAKVKLNPILEQISGKVGDLVFRCYGDKTVITQKPYRRPPVDRSAAGPP